MARTMKPLDLPEHVNVIEDLGMQYATEARKTRQRYIIIECISCGINERKAAYSVKVSQHAGKCSRCSKVLGSTKHGMCSSDEKLYYLYNYMKQRCYNTNNTHYDSYGGRGIEICREWLTDRVKFFAWAKANGYKHGVTIDRIDNDGNYSPQNCRFASRNTQSRNQRKLRRNNTSGYRGVTKNGENWGVSITVDNIPVWLGTYTSKIEAAEAYDAYVITNDTGHTLNKEYRR